MTKREIKERMAEIMEEIATLRNEAPCAMWTEAEKARDIARLSDELNGLIGATR